MTLETLGRKHGSSWQSDWAVPDPNAPQVERVRGNDYEQMRVRDDARGFLRGFPVIKASDDRARALTVKDIGAWYIVWRRFLATAWWDGKPGSR